MGKLFSRGLSAICSRNRIYKHKEYSLVIFGLPIFGTAVLLFKKIFSTVQTKTLIYLFDHSTLLCSSLCFFLLLQKSTIQQQLFCFKRLRISSTANHFIRVPTHARVPRVTQLPDLHTYTTLAVRQCCYLHSFISIHFVTVAMNPVLE